MEAGLPHIQCEFGAKGSLHLQEESLFMIPGKATAAPMGLPQSVLPKNVPLQTYRFLLGKSLDQTSVGQCPQMYATLCGMLVTLLDCQPRAISGL